MSGVELQLPGTAAAYWERRARRYATQHDGLAAVCSYGMPRFYNRMIQFTQRRALAPWLQVPGGCRVLDVGCGIGRWSLQLAARGAIVHGIDLSPTMIAIARRRACAAGLTDRTHFEVQDLSELRADGPYDLIVGVTVLQHILTSGALAGAIAAMRAQLAPTGRLVLLEAAPVRPISRCDSPIFTARTRAEYLSLFQASGLRVRHVGGVDPAPFKTWLLPHLRRLPRALALTALAAATALSVPVDAFCAARAVQRSWHALFVLEHASAPAGD